MTSTYDWIVVGNGITGAAVSYELAKTGCRVLLVERHASLQGATRYSYGGIAYWSAKTPLLAQLCQEGKARYPILGAELDHDIEFRELDLVLTIDADDDPEAIAQTYVDCMTPPTRLSVDQACELEPLLDPAAIAGALTVKHGHVNPTAMVSAYNRAFERAGGTIQMAEMQGLLRQGDRTHGIQTDRGAFTAAHVLISTGALARSFLHEAGLHIAQCFTHAELIETPPLDLQLNTLIMPADLQRFDLEAEAGNPSIDHLWDEPGREIMPPIIDMGAIQFLDGRVRIGQISRALTDLDATVDAIESERLLRMGIAPIIPALKDVPGQWHGCRVAFTGDRLPLIGPVPGTEGLSIFSGFSNPFAILPPLAQRFAAHMTQEPDPVVAKMAPDRPSLCTLR